MVKCYMCDEEFKDLDEMLKHVDDKHKDRLSGRTAKQDYYHYINRYRTNSESIGICSCGRPKAWLEDNNKYDYYCRHKDHSDKFRQDYKNNMNDKYGVDDYLKIPEHQREVMMSKESAKVYRAKDGTEFTVLSMVEYNTLTELEKLGYKGSDMEAPASMNIPYKDHEGVLRNHIPDIYVKPLNLIISCKDGFDNPNKHPNFKKDRIKNLFEYQAILNDSIYNYIQIEGQEDVKRISKYIAAVKTMRGRYVMPPKIDVYMLIKEAYDMLYIHENQFWIGCPDTYMMINAKDPNRVVEKHGLELNLGKIIHENDNLRLLDISSIHHQLKDMDLGRYVIGKVIE